VDRYKLFEMAPSGSEANSVGVRLYRAERIGVAGVSIQQELSRGLETAMSSSSEEVRQLLEHALQRVA
jgi:hypothetical protein